MKRGRMQFALAILCCVAMNAGAFEWRNLSPLPRGLASCIVDTANRRAVMFGGATREEYYNDVWELPLDTAGGYKWRPLVTSGTAPSARYGHAAVYDPVGRQMLVFGGNKTSGPNNDLWSLDLTTLTWRQLFPAGSTPPPNVFFAAVYHPSRHSMIFFDGWSGSQAYDAVWELDIDSLKWREVVVSGTRPSARWGYSVSYDAAANRLVTFGGQEVGMILQDVWALDLAPGSEQWTRLGTSGQSPGQRASFGWGLDNGTRTLYVYAGFTYPLFTFLNDLYALDLVSLNWTRLNPVGDLPCERRCPSAEFDPLNNCFFTFGGEGYCGHLSDAPYVRLDAVGMKEWEPAQIGRSEPYLFVPSVSARPVGIRYSVGESQDVTVRVMDPTGRVVRELHSGAGAAGGWLTWDGRYADGCHAPVGNYFCYLETGDFGVSRKFTLTE